MTSDWLPIESAPKDGTEILLVWRCWGKDDPRVLTPPMICIGAWHGLFGGSPDAPDAQWHGRGPTQSDGRHTVERLTHPWFPEAGPTHWMPLPTLPEPARAKSQES
jgi:hypothetical protein